MNNQKIAIIDKKIWINDLKKLAENKPNHNSEIVIKEKNITGIIYHIIPLAILTNFECHSLNGFSKRELLTQIYKIIRDLFIKKNNFWGIKYNELYIHHIFFYPKIQKLNVSIS